MERPAGTDRLVLFDLGRREAVPLSLSLTAHDGVLVTERYAAIDSDRAHHMRVT